MFSYFRKSWETGIEGNLIEDMIRNAFRDFAPYAGADQQQLRCIRRHSDGTTTSVIYEEDGEWAVNVMNPHVGTVAFTTTREVLFDLRARIPLRWGRRENINNNNTNINSNNNNNNNDSDNIINNINKESDHSDMRRSPPHDNNNNNINEVSTLTNENNASDINNNNNNNKSIQQEQQERPKRFFPSTNIHPSYHTPGTIGVLELLSSPASKRHGVGLSLGPLSLRATTLPPINNNNNNMNASNTVKSPDNTSSMYAFYRNPFIVDVSFCTSVKSILPEKLASLFPASCYLSTALQHPVGAIEGETLGAISLRSLSPHRMNSIYTNNNNNLNNNNTNNNNTNHINSNSSNIGDHYMNIWDCCDDFNLLVVQTLMKTAGSRNVLDDTTISRSSLLARDSSWRELGTLIGFSKSFRDGLLRLSASTMFHERDMDYEAAVTVDATALLANPTLLKVGINNIGRIGVSVATRLFDSLTITLGMHYTREADTRFGLEIAV